MMASRNAWLSLTSLLFLSACEPVASPRDLVGDSPRGDLPAGERYHQVGYDERGVHGIDLKLATEDCRECHGDQLDGGTAEVSCDECHVEDWRTDCTYCHGGDLDDSGAPSPDIDGATTNLSFPPHSAHLDGDDHLALSCDSCHKMPEAALTPGHLLDDTPARAEVHFSGRASGVQYDGEGGCSNMACHGNGQSGSVGNAHNDNADFTCESCHPWGGLTGRHREDHDGYECSECHTDAQGSDRIATPREHVDGIVQFATSETTLLVSGGTGSYSCTGFCHDGGHFFDSW